MNAVYVCFSNYSSGSTDIGMALMTLFLPIELWNDWRKRNGNVNGDSPHDDNLSRTIDSFDSFDEDLMSAKTSHCLFILMRDRTLELADQTKQKPWDHKRHMLAGEHKIYALWVSIARSTYFTHNLSVIIHTYHHNYVS